MKKSLVLAMAMALGVTASAYAANPFSDVPAGHWAYDSVAKLAAAGVVDGYADGAFDGDKLMTRYEMAQIVAKAMAKGADCDKLAAEFADELDTLGVRVAKLEKGADNVKITGETRLRYWSYEGSGKEHDKTNLRTRIWIKGQVNDDWTYTSMIENVQDFGDDDGEEDTKFQRAYVNGKLGGLKVQAGRYSYCDYLGGLVYDDRMEGLQLSYGKDVKLVAGFGKAKDGAEKKYGNGGDMAYVELGTKLGMVDAKVAYYKFEDVQWVGLEDVEMYALNAGLPLAKDLKFAATYLINETDIDNADDGYVLALNYKGAKAAKPGSWGLWAKWYDQPVGTYVAPTFEADDAAADQTFFDDMTGGFEGYGIGADYAIAKNIVAQVKWYDLEAQEGNNEREMLYTQVNFSF